MSTPINAWASADLLAAATTATGYTMGRYVSSAGRNASFTRWPGSQRPSCRRTRVDLPALDVVERLPHVLREHELRLDPSHSPSAFRLSSAYWPAGTVLGLPTTTFGPGVEEIGRLDDVDLGVGGLDHDEHVAREDRRRGGDDEPFFSSSSIWRWAAEMKRSTGAPASICFCSSPDEPKL